MPGRLERSDFARLAKYDVIELTWWATETSNGFLDSLRAVRQRRPEIVTLLNLSGAVTCSNYYGDGIYRKRAWADSVASHADTWLLRDVDGDLYVLNDADTACHGGHLNYYRQDMARAFARYIAESTVLRYPNDIDGIRLDDLNENIYYMNQWTWLHAQGVDSIDVNQDGLADTYAQLGSWWSAGVDTFLVTLRRLVGPETIIMVNGYIPPEAYQWVNGRFHEGFPHEHGDGWEKAMTHARRGFLAGDTTYSRTPLRLSGLPSYNASAGYNYDPQRLSTKDAPYPHPGFPGFLQFTLASYLLGEGYYGMTGMGTSVDWKGDPVPYLYQTLWWFPVYDTLKTYLGTPTGKAVRDTDAYGRDRFRRDFTGGRTRVFPQIRRGILDLKPRASFRTTVPAVVRAGEAVPIRVAAFDPDGAWERINTELRLSRDGGATFPELIAAGRERDSVIVWIPPGPAASCVLQFSAADTSGLSASVKSAAFRVDPARAASGGLAEIGPSRWIAHMPSLLCTLAVTTPGSGPSSGWNRILAVLPEPVQLLSFAGAEGSGGALAATATRHGDTLRVDLSTTQQPPAAVRIRFFVNAPSPSPGDSLRFAAAVQNRSLADGPVWLDPGDADGEPDDENALTVVCAYGPPIRLAIEPEEIVAAAGDTVRFRTTGFDQAGNAVEVQPAWALSDSLGTMDSTGLFRPARAGSCELTASAAGLSTAALVTIIPGPPNSLRISPRDAAVIDGQSLRFGAEIFDAFANPVLGARVSWSATDSLGLIDSTGLFHATGPGDGWIRAASGAASDSAAVRITDAPLENVFLHPRAPTVTADSLLRFAFHGVSTAGDTVTLDATWEVRGEGASIDSTGLFAPELAGRVRVVGTSGGWSDSTEVVVSPGLPAVLSVSPDSARVDVGDSAAFTAEIADRNGNPTAAAIEWSVGGGIGTIDAAGVFFAAAPGFGLVIAGSGALADTAVVAVPDTATPPGPPDTTETPAPPDTTAGEPASIAVRAIDAAYEARLWPSPLLLETALLDAEGDSAGAAPGGPFTVRLRAVAGTVAFCASSDESIALEGLPDTIAVPTAGIGGCGLLSVVVEGPGGLLSEPDTVSFGCPDVNGDLRIDLEDAGDILASWGTSGNPRPDLDADGLVGAGDLDVLGGAYEEGCMNPESPAPFGGEPPTWFALGDVALSCGGETLAARLVLDPASVESLTAVEIALPALGAWDRSVEWIPSSVWRSPLVTTLPDGPDGPRVLIVETDGVVVPHGENILEARVCGAPTESFGGGTSYVRLLRPRGEPTPLSEAPIRFLLDIEDPDEEPDTTAAENPPAFALFPNRPNPFHGSTTFRFAVPHPGGPILLAVYDVHGACVRVLDEGLASPGTHSIEWSGTDFRGRSLSPGVYFVRLRASARETTQKVLLLP
jgi:hypothetical protein